MGYVVPILLLFVGLAVGGLLAWLVMRGKAQHEFDRGKSEGESERAMPEIVGFGGTASAPNQWIARPVGHVGEAVVPPP